MTGVVRLRQRQLAGLLDDAPGPVRVRDGEGVYWEHDGAWRRLDGQEGRLAGPVEVPSSLVPAAKDAPRDPAPASDPEGVSSVEGFARAVGRLREGYDAGRLSSDAAESLASERFLVDVEGRVWQVGLASGDWYAFADGAWAVQEGPPDPQVLVRPERGRSGCHACGAAVDGEGPCPACDALPAPVLEDVPAAQDGLAAFLVHAPPPMLPERMVAPWDAP